MIRHFITIAFRNIRRNRLLSFIQIVGLSLGITAFILIALYTQYEKSWDTFNTNFDRIYRVQEYIKGDRLDVETQTSFPVANYLKNNIPEVEEAISIDTEKNKIFSSTQELTFIEDFGALAPSDVFHIFSFKLLQGNKEDVLDQPNSIVLSQTMEQKFFPGKNAVGEIIFDKEKNELLVTGIMEDIPANSHISAGYIRSIAKTSTKNAGEWGSTSCMTYVFAKTRCFSCCSRSSNSKYLPRPSAVKSVRFVSASTQKDSSRTRRIGKFKKHRVFLFFNGCSDFAFGKGEFHESLHLHVNEAFKGDCCSENKWK